MFGITKKRGNYNDAISTFVAIPPPPRKEFVTIRNLVDNIENYDNRSEFEVRNNSIDSLIQYLEKYKSIVPKKSNFNKTEEIYQNLKDKLTSEKTINRQPHTFCETPEVKCTMNYCNENGCQNRKREIVDECLLPNFPPDKPTKC